MAAIILLLVRQNVLSMQLHAYALKLTQGLCVDGDVLASTMRTGDVTAMSYQLTTEDDILMPVCSTTTTHFLLAGSADDGGAPRL